MALSDWSEKKLILVTGGVVAAVLVITGGLDLYVYWRYKALRDDVAAQTARLRGMEKDAKTLPQVRDDRDRERALVEELDNVVPDEDRMDELRVQIADQARQANLELKRIERKRKRSATRPVPSTGYEPIGLKIRCAGSYDSFGRFVNLLEEKMDRHIAVEAFRIEAFKGGLAPGMGTHDITIELKTYRRAAPPAAPAP